MIRHGFWRSLRATLGLALRDKAIVLMVLVAPLFYGFYYPWPYANQIVHQTPVGIVDEDHSALSRKIWRSINASPLLSARTFAQQAAAREALIKGEIGAYFLIPYGAEVTLHQTHTLAIPVAADGAYLLVGKMALTGVVSVLRTLGAEVVVRRFVARGVNRSQAQILRDPVPLALEARYNENEGYGNYVVPAVSWLILQQTLLIGAALLIGTLSEKKRVAATPSAWAGRVVALALLNMAMAFFYTGFVFRFQGYGYGGNPWGNALLIALFSPTVTALGCLFGLWFKERERALQILTFTSLPFYFLSGFSWPTELLPTPLLWLRWLIPTTSAIQAGVHFNQMNAPLAPNLIYLLALAGLGLLSFLALVRAGGVRLRRP